MPEADVIVIGGGIAGASAAYHLAEHGRSVILLERGEIASEASGVNAGGIGALGWGHVPDLEAHLTMGSRQIFRQLQLDLGYDIEFRASGGLQAIAPGAQYDYARERVLAWQARGYAVELLDINTARSIEPELSPELAGALYFPQRGQADPQKATRAFAAAAAAQGAQILTGQEVTGIAYAADGNYRVAASGDEYRSAMLALAAGAWCRPLGELLGLHIPIVPVRGQMWATAPLPPGCFRVCRRWNPTLIGAGTPAATPMPRPN